MPNYRQKNKKKNNKKNKNNQNKQKQQEEQTSETNQIHNQNQNQGTLQQQEKEHKQEKITKLLHDDKYAGNVSNVPTVDNSNKDHVDHIEKYLKDDAVVPLTTTTSKGNAAEANTVDTIDTVSQENSTKKELLVDIDIKNDQTNNNNNNNNMGIKQSKETTTEQEKSTSNIPVSAQVEEDDKPQLCVNKNEIKNQQVKVIIHRIVPQIVDCTNDVDDEQKNEYAIERQTKVITHAIAVEEEPEDVDQAVENTDNITTYKVQSPSPNNESFENANDTLVIQEIFNEDEEHDETLPTSAAAKTDDYKLKRAQKRVALENHFLPQLLSPRYLDSILEENSDLSDGPIERAGLLRSLSASSGETEYLQELKKRRANVKFPRSHLDFSKTHKHGDLPNTLPTLSGPISEEPLAMMVEAKLIEQFPNHTEESCTKLTFKHLEEAADAAEVIFINSSTSSSTSDLMELDEQEQEEAKAEEEREQQQQYETINLDTDANDIISKPTAANKNDLSNSSTCSTDRETTPVNNAIEMKLITNEEYDHLNSDEQYSQCSTESETIVDVSHSQSSSTSITSELPKTAIVDEIKNFVADDSSVLSSTSTSNSSIVDDASGEDSSSAEAFARLEETCREIMDNVREIVYANGNDNDVQLTTHNNHTYNGLSYGLPPKNVNDVTYMPPHHTNGKQKSTTPPPIPPPPQLASYINATNNHVPSTTIANQQPQSQLSSSVLLERQESADSHCSSSSTNQSQCTAINIAERDMDVSSPTTNDLLNLKQQNTESIQKLRQLCTQKLAMLPYGEQVLIELANLAENIGKMPLKRDEEVASNLKELHDMIIVQQQENHEQKKVQFAEQITPKSNEIVHKILFENERCEQMEKENEILRNRMTPSPPPLPPPPVPMRSSETAAKINSRIIPIVFEQKNDVSNEQKTTFTKQNEDDSIKQKQQAAEQKKFTNETSSVENNSRQTENNYATGKEFQEEKHFSKISTSSFSNNFPLNAQHQQPRPLGEMQGVETEIGRMFPNLGTANIFDDTQKRYSNIESNTRTTFPNIKPKRYSNIETSSFEAQKRIENGQVVYNIENKQHETLRDGDEVDSASVQKNANKYQNDIKLNLPATENMRSTFNLNETKNTTTIETSDEIKQTATHGNIDEKKLFKDFDELSQQLHHELETGRQQREKSASLFDLNREHMKHQLEELKQQRQAHLNELEREIQRSMKSREARRDQEYEIPIQMESKTDLQHDANSAFRRTESLFNLNNNSSVVQQEPFARPRTASSNYELQQQQQQQQQLLSDDWSQYASDLGSSENIARPFARETQVCYQRMSPRPREIRAPRLTVSSHDLSSTPNTFDPCNAYNVPRTKRTPSTSLYSLYEGDTEKQSAQFYSVLQRDPNPTYIGTTSRRRISPAPQQPTHRPQPAPRRASLPREIHEQQLKYITSKEDELRLEFERLQNERQRLMEEMQVEHTKEDVHVQPQVPPRTKSNYRAAVPRLPTLSEDEALRQQMAEEWMSKVAEREERRLQKTIKISKIQEEQLDAKQYMEDLSQEFLERVKERRHKLHMPADSDWESGAESQPNKASKQLEESVPQMKVMSGKSVADSQNLPQHLKEFARYSNQETEQLVNGGKRNVFEEEERQQQTTPYSSSSATKKSTLATTYKVSRQPIQTLPPHGQGECTNTKEENTTKDIIDHASTSYPAVNNNNTYGRLKRSSSTSSFFTNSTSRLLDTGSFMGTALAIGMGVLGAWARFN